MKVYVVLSGEDGEGGTVEGVYLQMANALRAAAMINPEEGDWVRIEPWDVL